MRIENESQLRTFLRTRGKPFELPTTKDVSKMRLVNDKQMLYKDEYDDYYDENGRFLGKYGKMLKINPNL